MTFYITSLLRLDKLVNIIVTIFVCTLMLDPTGSLLHLKTPVFCLTIALCLFAYRHVRIRTLVPVFVIYLILIVTSIFGFFGSFDYDTLMIMQSYKAFTLWLLIPWVSNMRLFDNLTLPAVIIALISIALYVTFLYWPNFSMLIYDFIMGYKNGGIPIMISNRYFAGIEFLSVYYKTSALFIIPMSIFFYEYINNDKNNKKKSFLLFLLYFSVLIISGTRANMLSSVVVILIIYICRLWKSRADRIKAIIVCSTAFFLGIIVLSAVLTDTNEESMVIKMSMGSYYADLFKENPQILIFGQGVGSYFNSGPTAHGYTTLTEWTFLEMIRWFGFPLFIVVLSLYLLPLWILYKKRTILKYSFVMGLSYLLYVLIAGTNPLLISSTGMLAMLIVYSYALNPYYEQQDSNTVSNI